MVRKMVMGYDQIKKSLNFSMEEARNIMKVPVEKMTHIKGMYRNNIFNI